MLKPAAATTEMSVINAIKFKDEPVLTVQLPYLDSTICGLVKVEVNTRVWAKYCHLQWVVMTPKVAAGDHGANTKMTGMYVRTKYPLNNPLYLHVQTFKYYHGPTCLEGGLQVDHIGSNPLFCDIVRLRSCTPSQNCQARGCCSTAKVQKKGIWLHKNGNYVVEWQYPQRKDIKLTRQKKGMTRGMATLLWNRISKHYSPEWAYQNDVDSDEQPTSEQMIIVDKMYASCIEKIESKLKQPIGTTSSDDDASSTASVSPSAKKQRIE